MSPTKNTYLDFLSSANIEKSAGIESFEDNARLPLDEKLRLGNAAGPLTCKSSERDEATFTPHSSIPFDWGKLKPESTVHPVTISDILRVHSKHSKGKLSLDTDPASLSKGYVRDADFSLTSGENYLFEETHFDGIEKIISILKACSENDTWPLNLPDSPFLTAAPDARAEARAFNACLDERNPIFAIKGPPGTGKTDLLAEVALRLAQAGKKVGIVAVSHDAVNNALSRVAQKLSAEENKPTIKKHGNAEQGRSDVASIHLKNAELPDIWGGVLAAATHMFGRDRDNIILNFQYGTCDVLLLDEAGQIPVYEAAALSHLAERMILFGDEDQLPNISKGSHPPGSNGDSSAMRYIRDVLDPAWTIALETSHRMNESICGLIQRHFYPDIPLKAGKNATAHLLENELPFPSLIKEEFPHTAPRLSRSDQEASHVAEWVKRLLTMQVVLENQPARAMSTGDIAILTPFRAHAAAISNAIKKAGIQNADKLRIGTVDKMQGQGAAAVIYSLASSSQDYIANQAEWLFSANRWNVAISRAQACAIVVGDFNAHFSAVPNALCGIAAQRKIRELMEDNIWTAK